MSKKDNGCIVAFENPKIENSIHEFSIMVPNMIDELNFTISEKNGIKTTKRLSVYAKVLYCYILECELMGDVCHNLPGYLAFKIHCSKNETAKAIQELLMPMNQLKGKPLIAIEKGKIEKMLISPDEWRKAETSEHRRKFKI